MSIENLSKKLTDFNGYRALEVFSGEVTIYSPIGLGFDNKSFKKPKKKEIDLNWLINKCKFFGIEKQNKNFIDVFKVLEKIINKGLNIKTIATSYGLGVDVFFNNREATFILKDKIIKILESKNIDCDFEFSDACWVLRIKISKSKNNIEAIKKLS